MAKVRLLAIVLLVTMASLSVGFAWTSTISVGATIQSGSLQIGVLEVAVIHDGTLTVQTKASEGAVSFTIGGMYPGAEATLHVKNVNTGHYDVRLRSAQLTAQGNAALKTYLQVQSGYQYDANGDRRIDGGARVSTTWQALGTTVEVMNESRHLKNTILRPDGSFYIGKPMDGVSGALDHEFKIRLSDMAPNEVQNTTASFELRLNWEQVVSYDEDEEEENDSGGNKHTCTSSCLPAHWAGLVELRWRKVMDLRTQGWRVYGDLYLIGQDGSRLPFVTGAVSDSFQRYGKLSGQTRSFVVTAGKISRCYTVVVPVEPGVKSVMVLGPRLMVPTSSMPPQVTPLSLVRSDAPQYAFPVGQKVTNGGPVTGYPQFFSLNRPLYPGTIQLHDLRLMPIRVGEASSTR